MNYEDVNMEEIYSNAKTEKLKPKITNYEWSQTKIIKDEDTARMTNCYEYIPRSISVVNNIRMIHSEPIENMNILQTIKNKINTSLTIFSSKPRSIKIEEILHYRRIMLFKLHSIKRMKFTSKTSQYTRNQLNNIISVSNKENCNMEDLTVFMNDLIKEIGKAMEKSLIEFNEQKCINEAYILQIDDIEYRYNIER
ncbi:hypothetical protein A3Q56_00685 [Intoshia linei]|uniref:Uncharacterized protein n=1 Tax=Intoshia linei TaxID=1819745 RepID=A0A177BB57_9BILA|nr:hypothetical protein A3Q56_00685 [Intoshia linei]